MTGSAHTWLGHGPYQPNDVQSELFNNALSAMT